MPGVLSQTHWRRRIGSSSGCWEQVFLVLEGEGWVEGETGERIVIQAGEAAFWMDGENHRSGSEHGLTAMLIEGSELDIRLSLHAK
ncbi:hypothetical protein [Paenibacillus illinoisensis]|uniref:hypothetical protein n=1 Tax=Paenibacillus illinoisensis TaxID=59845 RepID=UPI0021AD8BF0|nr:hypothetical protein [Paenibacillus illinoisensis]